MFTLVLAPGLRSPRNPPLLSIATFRSNFSSSWFECTLRLTLTLLPTESTHTLYKNAPYLPPSFSPSLAFMLSLFLHYSMRSPYNSSSLDPSNSFPNDVDPSSPPSNNVISHKVAPSSQDQSKQPLVDRCLSTINPDISQPSATHLPRYYRRGVYLLGESTWSALRADYPCNPSG